MRGPSGHICISAISEVYIVPVRGIFCFYHMKELSYVVKSSPFALPLLLPIPAIATLINTPIISLHHSQRHR